MATCLLCDEAIPDAELLDHLRVIHPDAWGDGPSAGPTAASSSTTPP